MFDDLLLLQNANSLYFGSVGVRACDVIQYFEKHGARPCGPEDNPADWCGKYRIALIVNI